MSPVISTALHDRRTAKHDQSCCRSNKDSAPARALCVPRFDLAPSARPSAGLRPRARPASPTSMCATPVIYSNVGSACLPCCRVPTSSPPAPRPGARGGRASARRPRTARRAARSRRPRRSSATPATRSCPAAAARRAARRSPRPAHAPRRPPAPAAPRPLSSGPCTCLPAPPERPALLRSRADPAACRPGCRAVRARQVLMLSGALLAWQRWRQHQSWMGTAPLTGRRGARH